MNPPRSEASCKQRFYRLPDKEKPVVSDDRGEDRKDGGESQPEVKPNIPQQSGSHERQPTKAKRTSTSALTRETRRNTVIISSDDDDEVPAKPRAPQASTSKGKRRASPPPPPANKKLHTLDAQKDELRSIKNEIADKNTELDRLNLDFGIATTVDEKRKIRDTILTLKEVRRGLRETLQRKEMEAL